MREQGEIVDKLFLSAQDQVEFCFNDLLNLVSMMSLPTNRRHYHGIPLGPALAKFLSAIMSQNSLIHFLNPYVLPLHGWHLRCVWQWTRMWSFPGTTKFTSHFSCSSPSKKNVTNPSLFSMLWLKKSHQNSLPLSTENPLSQAIAFIRILLALKNGKLTLSRPLPKGLCL